MFIVPFVWFWFSLKYRSSQKKMLTAKSYKNTDEWKVANSNISKILWSHLVFPPGKEWKEQQSNGNISKVFEATFCLSASDWYRHDSPDGWAETWAIRPPLRVGLRHTWHDKCSPALQGFWNSWRSPDWTKQFLRPSSNLSFMPWGPLSGILTPDFTAGPMLGLIDGLIDRWILYLSLWGKCRCHAT